MNIVANLCRQSWRKPTDKLRILTSPTHERNATLFSDTDAHYYLWRGGPVKEWNFKFGPLPSNFTLLDIRRQNDQIYNDLDIDLVLSQNRFGQYQILSQLARHLHIPLITYEHTWILPDWNEETRKVLRSMTGVVDVFISETSRNIWGWDENTGEVIRHALDTSVFFDKRKERNGNVLLVANDLLNRAIILGYPLFKEVVQNITHTIVGDTAGLSQPAKDVDDLVNIYNNHKIYLNTTHLSPIPMSMLESMACGCVPVALPTCEIPYYITHGVSGFLGKNAKELRNYVKMLMNDDKLREKMSVAARQEILEKCQKSRFTAQWNDVFRRAVEKPYWESY